MFKFLSKLLFFTFFTITSVTCFAASYQVAGPATPYTWIDISASGTNVSPALADDAVSGNIPIGFTFNYGGSNYTQLVIGSNGWLFFGATSTVYTNTTVATTPVSNVLMPYWDDLNPNGVAGSIKYQTLGAAPNRQFIVSYLAVPTYPATGANTFQVVLNENGTILYNYQSTNDQGASATIGYQVNTNDLVQFSFNTASVPNLRTLTWSRILPSLLTLKTFAVVSDPINNATNPKNIPGAVASYTINVSNTSEGVVDGAAILIADGIPANTEMFTGGASNTAPFTFTDGIPASGLTCAFVALGSGADCIEFSSDNGVTWNYVPINTSDYDPAVTNIRLRPAGVMNGDAAPVAAPYPGFSISFRVRIK